MPDSAAITGFYPEGYWWNQKQQPAGGLAGLVTRLERRYREFVALDHVRFLEHCARQSPGSGRKLLDVGCGGGTFLHLARRRDFVPHGLDVSAQAVSVARDEYGLDVRQGHVEGNSWEDARFDFITMFHVLEHLPEPCAALKFAAARLKPGGSLIIQVPNADSLQARIFGTRWYGLDVPRHLVNLTPSGLAHLLRRQGFEGKVVSRFSLRDNPASLASSLFPSLDPIGRKGRRTGTGALAGATAELIYFALVLAVLPIAFLESLLGHGATLWVHARIGENWRTAT
jgi:SAM-dependent methyltransferase